MTTQTFQRPGYYSVKEAAEISKYSYKYLLRLINEGKLTAYKPTGGKWVIKEKDLLEFMEGQL